MKSRHNFVMLTCLLITQAVLAGHLCTAGEPGEESTIVNPSVLDVKSIKDGKISLEENSSFILTANSEIPKALTSNPKVVKLVPLTPTRLQLSALRPGVTTVSFWQVDGEMRTVDVIVTPEGGQLTSLLDRLYPETEIEVVPLASSVLLRGFVDNPRTINEIRQIAEDFYPKVINLVTVEETARPGQMSRPIRRTKMADLYQELSDASPPKPELKQEIRALRKEVGALRRDIGQLTAAIRDAQPTKPNADTQDSRSLPRRSSRSRSEYPFIHSKDRIGWPIPHSVKPLPAVPPPSPFSPAKSGKPKQVMMEARIFEIDEQAGKKLLDKADRTGNLGRDVADLVRGVIEGQLPDGEGVQPIEGSFVVAVDADEKRLTQWTRQLIENDVAIVSQRTVVTFSGRAATIQRGGEFPIVVPQALGKVAVEFRQFGSRIEMIPKVVDDQKIQLRVNPRFSELDNDAKVTVDGQDIPGLKTVHIQTAMELEKGQSLLIGGLPLGKKRHLIIVTPSVVPEVEVADKPSASTKVFPGEPRSTSTRK